MVIGLRCIWVSEAVCFLILTNSNTRPDVSRRFRTAIRYLTYSVVSYLIRKSGTNASYSVLRRKIEYSVRVCWYGGSIRCETFRISPVPS